MEPITIDYAYDHLDEIRELFQEYNDFLGIDLSFQNFSRELADLPGKYALPKGRLLLARSGNNAAGCAAIRPAGENTCEMKRLFVRPAFRGQNVGEMLVDKLLRDAKDTGYSHIVLDTLGFLESAVKLYKRKGFYEIRQYNENPMENALFMRYDLK